MATISKTCDVFISHTASDSHLAAEIAQTLETLGLETFHAGAVELGSDIGDAIWQAIAECRALIAIVSPNIAANAMGMVEIGAATAWNKPVFVLINGPSSTKLPPGLSQYPVFPLSRLEEVIRTIRTGFVPLTEDECTMLVEIYRKLDTPADELSQSPTVLDKLVAEFNHRSHQTYSAERLLSELLRLRKKGQLPHLRSRA